MGRRGRRAGPWSIRRSGAVAGVARSPTSPRASSSSPSAADRATCSTDAGSKGTIGPNLDDSFRQAIADGLGRDTIEGVVSEQIAFPQGGQMPANLVEGDDRKAVAAYVADVAGKRGGGTTGPAGDGPGGEAKANAKNEVEIPADSTGQLLYEFKSASAKPGNVTLLSKNDSPVPHDISLKGGGVDEKGNQVTDGEHIEGVRQGQGRQVHLLLQRPRPRAGRDEGNADGQSQSAVARRQRDSKARAPRLWCPAGYGSRSCSRSTTTCETGSANRSRARSTTSRSSQFERPGG